MMSGDGKNCPNCGRWFYWNSTHSCEKLEYDGYPVDVADGRGKAWEILEDYYNTEWIDTRLPRLPKRIDEIDVTLVNSPKRLTAWLCRLVKGVE